MSDINPDDGTVGHSDEIVADSRVVLDGDVSMERLLALIRFQREENALDYKSSYDLSGRRVTKDKLSMVADVVAMANTSGGYIVLGVEEDRTGAVAAYQLNGIHEDHLEALDITKLVDQIESYLSVPIQITLQRHYLDEYGGKCFALVYIEESPQSPIIMNKLGQYEKDGRNIVVFRAGDVLVRRGASTQRVDQNDMQNLISKIRSRERDRWTEEILGVRKLTSRVDRLLDVLGDRTSVPGSEEQYGRPGTPDVQDETNYFLGASAFEDVVLGALRADDDIGLMWYLNNATLTFYRALEEAAASDDTGEANRIRDNRLEPLLDNLAVLAITCARYQRFQYLSDVSDTLYGIYDRAHATDFDRFPLGIELRRSWVWEAVIKRVYTIGAALLWLGVYEGVPKFIRQRVLFDDYYRDRFWAKHALTMRSRDGGLTRQGLCAVTEDFIRRREWFYRVFEEDESKVIASLCQFDFLQCIHAINETDDARAGYPSFGIYYNSRTEPVLSEIVRDDRARGTLLPDMPDDKLAAIVKDLDEKAEREFVMFNGWDGNYWHDPAIRSFLDRFPDPVS